MAQGLARPLAVVACHSPSSRPFVGAGVQGQLAVRDVLDEQEAVAASQLDERRPCQASHARQYLAIMGRALRAGRTVTVSRRRTKGSSAVRAG